MDDMSEPEDAASAPGAEGGDPIQTVSVSGELDFATADALRYRLQQLEPGGVLVVEARSLSFMDSSGIAVLLEAAARHDLVTVTHASDAIRRVIEATGLSSILRVQP
jgi:anti-anti-sigma factor